MIHHACISNKDLFIQIRTGSICYGGNLKLKIFGTLHCGSGKRIHKQNRVFFNSVKEAVDKGFRPCGHCMKQFYKTWRNEII